jgi:hypothetical protein
MWSTIAIVLSLAALEVAEPQPKGDPAADLLEVFATGLANGDARAVNNALAPNVTVYWVDGTIRGRQNMMDYLSNQTRLYTSVRLSIGDVQPATSRTVSVVWGEGELSMEGRGMSPSVNVQGRYHAVAQKLKTGWALTSIHFSVTYPPAYQFPPK